MGCRFFTFKAFTKTYRNIIEQKNSSKMESTTV